VLCFSVAMGQVRTVMSKCGVLDHGATAFRGTLAV
jgi:hypothetical protein